jgi:hypothetical protein
MSWIDDEFRKLDRSARALRRFGYLVGAIFLLLGCLLLWRHRGLGWPLTPVGAFLIIAAALAPLTLKWVYVPWMILAAALGWIVTRILLAIVFFLVVTPIGLLQRFFGKRPIEIAFRTHAVSYWQTRAAPPAPKDYEKQF